jgi:hypothetical protein
MTQYAVVWTTVGHAKPTGELRKSKDHYAVFDDLMAAREKFTTINAKVWRNKELFICSIMAIVESTDYRPHPLLRGL